MLNDFLNVISILTSLDAMKTVGDITLFNMDGMKKEGRGRIFNDRMTQYFSLYRHMFRRFESI